LFCQEDRAILCRDCDIPIHTANEHTQKHNRFLLTGVKLSATSTRYTSSSSSAAAASTDVCEPVPDHKSQPVIKNSAATSLAVSPTAITDKVGEKSPMDQTSSISEYLIETLPGWHVEEFLDSTYDPFGFCKVCISKFKQDWFHFLENMYCPNQDFCDFLDLKNLIFVISVDGRAMMVYCRFWMLILGAIWVLSRLRVVLAFGSLNQLLLCFLHTWLCTLRSKRLKKALL
jgi:hypothetical protein